MSKRLFLGLAVAALALFMFLNNPALAQSPTVTVQDLIKQIEALQKQIQALRAQIQQPAAVPQQVGQSVADFNKNLFFGLRQNSNVMDVQEFLTDQGYYAGPITGNFGLLTLQAVRKFQSANGINPTGYWGPKTQAAANQIMRKIVGIICKSEESCPGDVLPPQNLKITSDSLTGDSTLPGIVGTYFVVNFKVSRGSGNYEITPQSDNPPGLSFTRTYCPSGLACAQIISPDTITLYGTPTKAGVYDVVISARDSYKCTTDICPLATSPVYFPNSYGKARFSVVIKDKIIVGQPPVISGVKGPTTLKTGEVGIWTISASNPQSGNLSYRVVWGDEGTIAGKEGLAAPQAVPFIQTATFSHVYQYPGVYSPIFYVVNDRGQEAKTSLSVNVKGTAAKRAISWTDKKSYVLGETIKFFAKATDDDGTPFTPEEGAAVWGVFVSPAGVTTGLYERGNSMNYNPTSGYYEKVTSVDTNEVGNWAFYVIVTRKGDSDIILATSEKTTFILSKSTQPSITVLSPNGGEKIVAGGQINIHWSTSNWPESTIGLSLTDANNNHVTIIGTLIPNTGSYVWNIPTGSWYTSNASYKVRAGCSNCILNKAPDDFSDAPFSIVSGGATTGSLRAIYVSGNKSQYAAGEKISLVIKGTELFDGSSGEASEGFNIQTYIRGVNDGYNLQGVNAAYNSQTGYWEANLTAPANVSKSYIVDSAFYCSNGSLVCGTRYASGKTEDKGQVNASFNFSVYGTGKTSVTVVSPNGGESYQYQAGQTTQVPIKWTADCGYKTFSLFLGKGDFYGFSGRSINDSIPAVSCTPGQLAIPYSFTWTLPSDIATGNDYKILITGQLADSIVGKFGTGFGDDSDTPFSIVAATPSITVLSPNGGERWEKGKTYTISWKSTGVSTVEIRAIDVSTGGSECRFEECGFQRNISANLGSYSWTVPGSIREVPNYRIVIVDPNRIETADQSNAPFSIVAGPNSLLNYIGDYSTGTGKEMSFLVSSPISVTETVKFSASPLPTGALFLLLGDVTMNGDLSALDAARISQYLSGYTTLSPAQKLLADANLDGVINQADVDLVKSLVLLTATPKNAYVFVWTPSSGQSGTYKVTFYANGVTSGLSSSQIVTVTVDISTQPSITVLSPDGGEVWQVGTTQTIRWTSQNLPADAQNKMVIEFQKGSNVVKRYSNIVNDGTETMTIPADLALGSDYRVNVLYYLSGSQGVIDSSDAPFSIVAGTQTSIMPSPIAHWKFDEGAGTTAVDTTGNGNTASFRNNPVWTTGRVGGALSFDGVDDYLAVTDSPSFDIKDITLAAWIKISGSADVFRRVISQQDSSNFWVLMVSGNRLTGFFSLDGISGQTGHPGGISYGPLLNDNQWHHIALTRDTVNNVITWWVDGKSVGTFTTLNDAVYTVSSPVTIGSYVIGAASGQYFPGIIDDVRVYNRALTGGEIAQVYAGGGGTVGSRTYDSERNRKLAEIQNELFKLSASILSLLQNR